MDSNLDKIALDLYGKIQTRFPDIKIGDENATVLSKKQDIPKARFFEFEYEEGGEPLGTIAITLDADDGIVVQVSGDLVNDDVNTTSHSAYAFIRSFRKFAKNRLLNFDVQNIGKTSLDKRDYEFKAKRKEETMEPIMENKMYGNAKMSYQDLGEARLVVKHSQPVNLDLAAGRTMHIESIYIENAQGERFRYPFKHLNGARALAEHIKAGGNPYDGIGKHICNLSEELASLRKFKGYVNRQEQLSEAMSSVTGRVMERIEEIKKTIHQLQRPAFYQAFAESFEAQEEVMIPEEVQNDLIDRLTIRTFNEELKSVFPYIAKFVNEHELPVIELGADDLLDEVFAGDKETGNTHRGGKVEKTKHGIKHTRTDYDDESKEPAEPKSRYKQYSILDPEDQFESFLEDIVREDKDEIFSPNKDAQHSAIEKLNQVLSQELKGGPEGINATQSLKGLIDDPEFLMSLRDIDPDLDVRPLVQQFVLQQDPEVATQLHFGGEEGGAGEAEAPPAPAPAAPAPEAPMEPSATPAPAPAAPEATPPAPAPVAEGNDDSPPWDVDPKDKKSKPTTPGKHGQGYSQARHLARQGLADTLKKAKKAGATMETQLDFGHGVKTIAEIIAESGMSPEEVGFEQAGGIEEMLKFVSGFYNREKGNFPLGAERIKIKVEKEFEDGNFGNCGDEDLHKILAFIDKKDSGSAHHQHNDIMRLAGVNKHHTEVDENPQEMDLGNIMNQFASMKDGGQSPEMKFKFGDNELDLNQPDQVGDQIKKMMGGMMKGVQGQVPNQTVQIPGGQINPNDMMKQIMQKINFGN